MSILEVKDLYVEYNTSNFLGNKQTVYAVNGVSFEVNEGEIFSIAGESGCGKSSLLRAIAHLVDIKSGKITYNGLKKDIQMIFQTPSLNPKMKLKDIIIEPLLINEKHMSKKEKEDRVFKVLDYVGLLSSDINKYPHEFSGGQKQRISIARALISEPKIILADEPVSALDVSIQGQIINLLKKLKENLNLTIIFISHDLNVIRYISDKVAIMYLGEIVEQGSANDIFTNPLHPYSIALLSANPSFRGKREILKGELPSPINLPIGCKFNTRCPKALAECERNMPYFKTYSNEHIVRCHLY